MNNEERNEIIHRWQNKQSARSIARELSVSRYMVDRVIRTHAESRNAELATEAGIPPASLRSAPSLRSSKLDAHNDKIKQLLERYPKITAQRVFEEIQRDGYDGGHSILRQRIRFLRKTPLKQLVVRFETAPGVQAQMDWATYDVDFSMEGKRRVNLFSYILGYSRRQYIHFTETMDFETTIRQHILAFEHLGGVAATCLYDNMKVVVTRWEDDAPIYNTRFLSFATHYGYKPWACEVRRPQTKGKVERPFHYIETNLLNGREFRSLEHLNETTRWWLSQVADVRIHGTTKKTPLELHAEEIPHLLPMPSLQFDTAKVVYRVVDTDGTIQHANNRYSVPWRLVGETLPVRITDEYLMVYDRSLSEVARHALLVGQSGKSRTDPSHQPPRDHEEQMENLRQRYAELGNIGVQYLSGLESKQRNSKHQALKVLGLLHAYHKQDLLRAMRRAVEYYAYGYSALERILAHQSTPKPAWQQLGGREQATLQRLSDSEPIGARHSQEYQDLLYGTSPTDEASNEPIEQETQPKQQADQVDDDANNAATFNPPAPANAEDSPQ